MWMTILEHIPRTYRYTIGKRIEERFLDLLEVSYRAYYSEKDQKIKLLQSAITMLDIIKYLITIAWEGKLISTKHFESFHEKLQTIGRMLGGWKKGLMGENKKL